MDEALRFELTTANADADDTLRDMIEGAGGHLQVFIGWGDDGQGVYAQVEVMV